MNVTHLRCVTLQRTYSSEQAKGYLRMAVYLLVLMVRLLKAIIWLSLVTNPIGVTRKQATHIQKNITQD